MFIRLLRLVLLSIALLAPVAHAAIEFDSPVFYPTSGGTYDVALADVDLDGDLDAVSSNYDGQTIQVFLNTGLGAFAPPTMYPSPWALFTLVRDLDADGYPDLATANFQGNTCSTRRNNGDGTFGPPLTFAAPGGTRCIAATDWNNDGDLELVVIGSNASEYRIYERSGPGLTYALIQSGSTGNLPKWVTVGDLDGDSRDEVVIVNAFG